MDIATAISIITVSGMLITAVVSVIKHLKAPALKEQILELKEQFEVQKAAITSRFAELEARLAQLDHNSREVIEIKERLLQLERSVEADLNKFEAKLDRLLELVLRARH